MCALRLLLLLLLLPCLLQRLRSLRARPEHRFALYLHHLLADCHCRCH